MSCSDANLKHGDKAAGSNSVSNADTLRSAWVSLFRWENHQRLAHLWKSARTGKAWKAENGVLHLVADKKLAGKHLTEGDIVTKDEFENYDFKTDWKISRAGNSGIMFYVKEDIAKYPYPLEYRTGISDMWTTRKMRTEKFINRMPATSMN